MLIQKRLKLMKNCTLLIYFNQCCNKTRSIKFSFTNKLFNDEMNEKVLAFFFLNVIFHWLTDIYSRWRSSLRCIFLAARAGPFYQSCSTRESLAQYRRA